MSILAVFAPLKDVQKPATHILGDHNKKVKSWTNENNLDLLFGFLLELSTDSISPPISDNPINIYESRLSLLLLYHFYSLRRHHVEMMLSPFFFLTRLAPLPLNFHDLHKYNSSHKQGKLALYAISIIFDVLT